MNTEGCFSLFARVGNEFYTKLTARNFVRVILPVMLLLACAQKNNADETAVWFDNFEDGNGDSRWNAETGTWQIGSPTIGPNTNKLGFRTFSGQYCATTGLNENYPAGLDTRFIRIASFVVPATNQFPRLRFWHWFNFGYETFGTVEVREAGITNSNWTAISPDYFGYNSSGVWTRPSLDLRSYSGKTIQIAFRIQSQCCAPQGGPGWYIDDIALVTNTPAFHNPESFELGLGDWSAETGTWEVGVATSGPPTNALGFHAFTGTNCAATVLAGNYTAGVD